MDEQKVQEILMECVGDEISQQETQHLEFKQFFSKKELLKLCKHFAGFANGEGGSIIFGIQDKPRVLVGIDDKAAKEFLEIDPADISNVFLKLFSRVIRYKRKIVEVSGKKVGVLSIPSAKTKPIIAIKDNKCLNDGDVYYRYDGTTRKIRHTELEHIIDERTQQALMKAAAMAAIMGREDDIYKAELD